MSELGQFSRFYGTEKVVHKGVETYGAWAQPSFLLQRPDESKIKVFKVSSALEGKPNLIAERVYGTDKLEWVLIAFNEVRDVMRWPRAGDLIEYPSEELVISHLL